MIRNISIGVDIGTTMTRVVVGEFLKGEKNPKIIGIGESTTNGMRHGYVVNISEVTDSLKKAKDIAERNSGVKIKRAFVSIGGLTLSGETVNGEAVITKADGEVTSLDINKVLDDCEDRLNINNKKIIRILPISYKVDGKDVLGRPEGLKGTKLEAKTLFITCSLPHFEDLLEVIDKAGIEPIDIVASPLASARITISEKQKMVGGALVDIGGETTTLSVFDNGNLVALHTFSLAGENITNDIALGLRIPLELAEATKLGTIGENVSKKKLDDIIESRLSDIFELIENYLKKIKRNELLPAGIVFVGGGANIKMLEEYSKAALKLPSRVGTTEIFGNIKTKLRDPSWFTALGLILPDEENQFYSESTLENAFKNLKKVLMSNIKQLMP